MRLCLLAVGRLKAGPERDLVRRYLDRARAGGRGLGFADVVEIESDESRARAPEQRKRDEAAALAARIPPGSVVRLFDEHGERFTSLAFAAAVGSARDDGRPAFCLVIGGPDGLSPDLLTQFPAWHFGAATLPHQLVRVLAAEQIYRVTTILGRHPYHRA